MDDDLLRVMTYNIRLGGRNRTALREVVREACPDVLLVTESPKTPLLWRGRCRALAREWGMGYVAGGRDAGSNLVLVSDRVEVSWARTSVIPQQVGRPRRGVVSAQLSVGGRPLGVVGCHLSLVRDERLREVEAVIAAAEALDGVVVVGGDLNEPAGAPAWDRLRRAGFVDRGTAATFPAGRPVDRIDALLVRPGGAGLAQVLTRVAGGAARHGQRSPSGARRARALTPDGRGWACLGTFSKTDFSR